VHTEYEDIRNRIPEPPRWFDENAVPRYCDFHPSKMANIYAHEGALLRIECQGCGRPFLVAISELNAQHWMRARRGLPRITVAELIQNHEIHYGDPPNVECCRVGPTMNSIPKQVLEYWKRERLEWQRDPSLELKIVAQWHQDRRQN
jgi:hypothetical protein